MLDATKRASLLLMLWIGELERLVSNFPVLLPRQDAISLFLATEAHTDSWFLEHNVS